MSPFKLQIFILLLFFSACTKEEGQLSEIIFEKKTSSPEVSRACATTFVVNGKAYITGGRNKDLLHDCWEYNPETDQWIQKNNFPGEKRVFPISAVIGNKAYVGLGYNNGGVYKANSYLRDFWMYEVESDTWTRKADFPTYASNHANAFVYQEDIYVIHGFGPGSFTLKVWKYTTATDTWTALSDFPGYMRSCAVSCTDKTRFFSGTGYATWNENDWWEYFPETDDWERKKNMPDKGRINGISFSVNNRYFVATGRYFAGIHTGGHLKSDIIEYDPYLNKWFKRNDFPGGGRENAISFVLNNKVYVGFGENEDQILDDLWSFNP